MTKTRAALSAGLLLISVAVAGRSADRLPAWAAPVESRHLKNAYKLDDKLFRSAQPSREGFQEAEGMGITDVLNLREYHSDKGAAEGLGLVLHHVASEADEIGDVEIVSALRVIKQARGPVLVHCWHGSDRTGAVCAMYRIVFNHWPKEDAIDEMVNGGFGFHPMYENIVQYIRSADVDRIKEKVFAP
jgi:protein tyrosine phosphatase (PTP) superfamily phosphohydrolase (DUF442 family)